jgi:hypothetical protein
MPSTSTRGSLFIRRRVELTSLRMARVSAPTAVARRRLRRGSCALAHHSHVEPLPSTIGTRLSVSLVSSSPHLDGGSARAYSASSGSRSARTRLRVAVLTLRVLGVAPTAVARRRLRRGSCALAHRSHVEPLPSPSDTRRSLSLSHNTFVASSSPSLRMAGLALRVLGVAPTAVARRRLCRGSCALAHRSHVELMPSPSARDSLFSYVVASSSTSLRMADLAQGVATRRRSDCGRSSPPPSWWLCSRTSQPRGAAAVSIIALARGSRRGSCLSHNSHVSSRARRLFDTRLSLLIRLQVELALCSDGGSLRLRSLVAASVVVVVISHIAATWSRCRPHRHAALSLTIRFVASSSPPLRMAGLALRVLGVAPTAVARRRLRRGSCALAHRSHVEPLPSPSARGSLSLSHNTFVASSSPPLRMAGLALRVVLGVAPTAVARRRLRRGSCALAHRSHVEPLPSPSTRGSLSQYVSSRRARPSVRMAGLALRVLGVAPTAVARRRLRRGSCALAHRSHVEPLPSTIDTRLSFLYVVASSSPPLRMAGLAQHVATRHRSDCGRSSPPPSW